MRFLFVAAALTLATPAWAQTAPGVFGSPSRFTETTGAAIYQSVCAECHMADGRGAVGAGTYPSLRHDGNLAASGYPITLVLNGRGAMPSFARTLSDAQIAEVVGYIRQNLGNAYADAPSAAEVKAARPAP